MNYIIIKFTKPTLYINKINCFIKDILTKPTLEVKTIQQFQNKDNQSFLDLLASINIQNKDSK